MRLYLLLGEGVDTAGRSNFNKFGKTLKVEVRSVSPYQMLKVENGSSEPQVRLQ